MAADPTTVLTWINTPDVVGEIHDRKRQSFTRIIEQLAHRLAAIDDCDDILNHFTSLSESSLVNIASAPETHFQLTCPLRDRAQMANFIGYLEDSVSAENVRNDGSLKLDRPVWTSKRDLRFESHDGRTRCSYTAPVVDDTIVVDALSPTARRRSDGSLIESTFDCRHLASRAQDLATRLHDGLAFILGLCPITHRLIVTHLNVIVMQDDPKNGSHATISGRSFPGQAIFRNLPTRINSEMLVDSLIHEAIHSYLYAVEQKRPWLKDIQDNGVIRSPWTNNELRIDSYLHACFVWFGLFSFWRKALEIEAHYSAAYPFYVRARSGFLEANLSIPLRDWTTNIDPFVMEQNIGTFANCPKHLQQNLKQMSSQTEPEAGGISDCRWFLICIEDWDQLASASIPLSKFLQSASAQTVFYEPGSLASYFQMLEKFDSLGEEFPDREQALRIFSSSVGADRYYEFLASESGWQISNKHKLRTEPVFSSNEYVFCAIKRNKIFKRTCSRLELPDLLSGVETLHRFEQAGIDLIENIEQIPIGFRPLVVDLIKYGYLAASVERPENNTHRPIVRFLAHSSLLLRSNSTTVVVDPVCVPRIETQSNAAKRELMRDVRSSNFVVLSHNHWDHVHYQTLSGIPRDVALIVPHVRKPSFSNPPLDTYVRALGFCDVRTIDVGEVMKLGDIELTAMPFFGEAFGNDSEFDGFTYYFRWAGRTLYGSVDACFDERGNMDEPMLNVAKMGELDFFFFGSSDQHHLQPYQAPGPRRISDELRNRRDLLRYHPNIEDVARWSKIVQPKFLVPYAQFLFDGKQQEHLPWHLLREDESFGRLPIEISSSQPDYAAWLAELAELKDTASGRLLFLEVGQGILL